MMSYFTATVQDYSAANSGEDNSDLVREVTNFYNKSLTISQVLDIFNKEYMYGGVGNHQPGT